MGKRPRTPHFISGLGDGKVHEQNRLMFDDFLAKNKRNVRTRRTTSPLLANHHLNRDLPLLERDTFSGSGDGIPHPASTDGPWQITAMALLAIMGILVGVFLHLVTDSSPIRKHTYNRRTRRQPLAGQTKKKKTDEWSDDEQVDSAYGGDNEDSQPAYYSYQSPRYGNPPQEHRHRRVNSSSGALTHRGYYLPEPVVTSYKSPSSSSRQQAPSRSPVPNKSPVPSRTPVRSTRNNEPDTPTSCTTGLEGFQPTPNDTEASPKNPWPVPLHARPLSPASSFNSIERGDEETGTSAQQRSSSPGLPLPLGMTSPVASSALQHSSSRLSTTPGSDDVTPHARNIKPIVRVPVDEASGSRVIEAPPLMPSPSMPNQVEARSQRSELPCLPILEHPHDIPAPPESMSVEELHLVQMETGSRTPTWQQAAGGESPVVGAYPGRIQPKKSPEQTPPESPSSSNDPRKNIIHKRPNITQCTDAESSLLSSVDFSEVTLQSVIGGGGFGQVWKGTWRSTPVAVKLLTGQAQRENVSKSILEEFAAEINMLKGMRHPNICLYMGACFDPPNRCIITELAANGSVWDALRLPLTPPFEVADGTTQSAWPPSLYAWSTGGPPTSFASRPPPLPPRGTWPWDLVKRVACGSARGMTYLHSGKPPVLHRDLKSANILLDESYTAKVCDFGLSRLKAQERSMTGNCGTVQWMAPEVLANQRYAEPADVYSFGIILWELLTGECPYEGLTAIQCALAVLNRNLRPEIPKWCPPSLSALIRSCLEKDPAKRPTFAQILLALDAMP